eukprot:8392698-Pyramimonas_sp.AAC.1
MIQMLLDDRICFRHRPSPLRKCPHSACSMLCALYTRVVSGRSWKQSETLAQIRPLLRTATKSAAKIAHLTRVGVAVGTSQPHLHSLAPTVDTAEPIVLLECFLQKQING